MNINVSSDKLMSLAICLFAAYAALLLPVDALAQTTISVGVGTTGGSETQIGGLLCRVADWFTGSVGQGIATLAIIVIGIGALMGKVSWGMAIIVGIGVAVIFGAPTIVHELSGNSSGC